MKSLRPLLFPTAISILCAICAFAAGSALAAESDFHYLAADPSLRAQTQNANVVMGQANFVGEVLKLDQPWEEPFDLVSPGSVVIDPGTGQWRMYYELMIEEGNRIPALATSDNGITWNKEPLNITGTTYTDYSGNNIVKVNNDDASPWMLTPHVFIDPDAPASQRYRMAGLAYYEDYAVIALNTYGSADGKTWTQVGEVFRNRTNEPMHALDAQNSVFWDPNINQYAAHMRIWYPVNTPSRRGVMLRRSDTFDTTWDAELEFTLDPQDIAGVVSTNKPDIYHPDVYLYQGQYIGLPSMFYHPNGGNGAIYPTFMHSRNGTDWHFEDVYHPMIDLGAHGQNEQTFGMAYPTTSSIINRDGNLYIYYSYFSEQHEQERSSGTMCLATIREDRFVGIKSEQGSVGRWTTSEITLPSDPGQLIVNAVVGGSLLVEVLDPATLQPIGEFSAANGVAVTPGDYIDAVARWNGIDNLSNLTGQTVMLRFVMDDATVYSFHFEPTP